MRLRKSTTVWLPSTEQIMMASERAILAALDVNLELAIRSLKAEHLTLGPDGRLATDPDYQPYTFHLLPVAEALVLCASRLRELVASYRIVADGLLRDADRCYEPASVDVDQDQETDDEDPF